jgi:hypothetical protein
LQAGWLSKRLLIKFTIIYPFNSAGDYMETDSFIFDPGDNVFTKKDAVMYLLTRMPDQEAMSDQSSENDLWDISLAMISQLPPKKLVKIIELLALTVSENTDDKVEYGWLRQDIESIIEDN